MNVENQLDFDVHIVHIVQNNVEIYINIFVQLILDKVSIALIHLMDKNFK